MKYYSQVLQNNNKNMIHQKRKSASLIVKIEDFQILLFLLFVRPDTELNNHSCGFLLSLFQLVKMILFSSQAVDQINSLFSSL